MIRQRLLQIIETIKKSDFLSNKGLGNEVGYYVFDYDPHDEIEVRNHIKYLCEKNKPDRGGFEIIEFDIYNLMIELLNKEGVIADCYEMEIQEGIDYLIDSVVALLQLNDDNNYFAKVIEERTPINGIVFITGVGKIFPFVRSHKILNNLHQVFDRVPVVMFYPGIYDGQSLVLFNEFKDDNYYRAFPLVERGGKFNDN